MDSLWPKFDELEKIEENNSIEILRSQARAIKSETNGVVNATFTKMTYKSGPASAIQNIRQTMAALSSPVFEEVLDEELKDKTDINTLFANTRYRFELFNAEYRFRLFIVDYREMYPISLEVDEGIEEEITYKNNSPISNDGELKDVLTDIFSSRKVCTVVSRMLQKQKEESNGKDGI